MARYYLKRSAMLQGCLVDRGSVVERVRDGSDDQHVVVRGTIFTWNPGQGSTVEGEVEIKNLERKD